MHVTTETPPQPAGLGKGWFYGSGRIHYVRAIPDRPDLLVAACGARTRLYLSPVTDDMPITCARCAHLEAAR